MQRTFVKDNRLERINTGTSGDVNVVDAVDQINSYVTENADSLDYEKLDSMLTDFSRSIRVQKRVSEFLNDGWTEVISTPRAGSKTVPVASPNTSSNDSE